MMTIIIGISQTLIDSGFANALIRKKNRTQSDYTTVFYFNLIISIILYITIYVFAPAISIFYQSKELIWVARVMSLILPISALGFIQRTRLTIDIDFKTQAIANLIGAVIGGLVGVVFAFLKAGVSALVYSYLASTASTTLMFWIIGKWIPTGFISMSSFREMFKFGYKLLLSGLIDTAYRNIYQVIIGKKFNTAALGIYTRADQFAQLPSLNITSILQKITYPILCEMKSDTEKIEYFKKTLEYSAAIMFPCMMLLSTVSTEIIMLLLGEKWIEVSTILKILCYSYMLYPLHVINLNYIMMKGRSDLFLKMEIIKKSIGVVVFVTSMNFGITAMAIGTVFVGTIAFFINSYYMKDVSSLTSIKQIRIISPILLLSIFSQIFVELVKKFLIKNLILEIIIYISIFIIFSHILKIKIITESSYNLKKYIKNIIIK